MVDTTEAMAKLAAHDKAVISKAYIEQMMKKIHDEGTDFEQELHLTEEYIPYLAEIFIRHLEDPKKLKGFIEAFLFEDEHITEVTALHKELGIYDRNEWVEEMDKWCPNCSAHYLWEDPETNGLDACKKCGTKLEVNR